MMTSTQTDQIHLPPKFVWFEFDNSLKSMWKTMGVGGKSYAFHQRLATYFATPDISPSGFTTDLESLKVIDLFLAAVKSDLAHKNASELTVLNREDFFKLYAVILFHVVLVLGVEIPKILNNANMEVYAAEHFNKLYAKAFAGLEIQPLNEQEIEQFYYDFALLVRGVRPQGKVAKVIYILPILGAKIFGSMDRVFSAGLDDTGKKLNENSEESLYWAVVDFIEALKNQAVEAPTNLFNPDFYDNFVAEHTAKTPLQQDAVYDDVDAKEHIATNAGENAFLNQNPNHNFNQNPSQNPATVTVTNDSLTKDKPVQDKDESIQTSHAEARDADQLLHHIQDTAQAPTQNQNSPHNVKAGDKTSSKSQQLAPSVYKQRARASHTPKMFDEIKKDLQENKQAGDMVENYQKAASVLDKFEEFITSQIQAGKDIADIGFSEKQQAIKKQAFVVLANLAKSGNTAAMLRLANAYFDGRLLNQNIAQGVELTKRAAEAGDCRGQKLLSRLYYQGYEPDNGGVKMDVVLGEHWLRKAATGGHAEAKKVCAYMNQLEVLKNDQKNEIQSDKRYGMLFIGIGIGTVLIFIIMSILF